MKQTTKKKTERKGSAKKSQLAGRAEAASATHTEAATDPTLRERAEAIINGSAYNTTDRNLIKLALDQNTPNLAQLVEKMESGEGIVGKQAAQREAEEKRQQETPTPYIPNEAITNARRRIGKLDGHLTRSEVKLLNDHADAVGARIADLLEADDTPANVRAALVAYMARFKDSITTPRVARVAYRQICLNTSRPAPFVLNCHHSHDGDLYDLIGDDRKKASAAAKEFGLSYPLTDAQVTYLTRDVLERGEYNAESFLLLVNALTEPGNDGDRIRRGIVAVLTSELLDADELREKSVQERRKQTAKVQ